MATREIRLFGSPWSAPAWMKTNNNLTHGGSIQGAVGGEYWKAWAKYLIRYLDAYKAKGINHWGMTVQNEPYAVQTFNSMYYTPEMMRDFLAYTLGPALEQAGYGIDKLKVMIWDHNLNHVQEWVNTIMSDKNAAKYAAGTGIHWYSASPQTLLDQPHESFPDKFILATEACVPKVRLGAWGSAEHYASDIIQDMLHWVIGWTDWNMVLDTTGGPVWAHDYLDAPIIIDPAANQYYRQPHFYAMGHFSKFIPPGSFKVDTVNVTNSGNRAMVAAFRTPQNSTVIEVVNNDDATVQFSAEAKAGTFTSTISPHSFSTFVFYD